ncbi:GDSL family lipase [Ramlibacter sp. G-1-2-2]|uniref:GDSL family lipase n=1 Tax=Ramlibacter agri TaxID=2728837 RepID=A0A848GZI9_9BURK|nr:SGNH/GDSL hydrolase family protein [Ramlibacter agri]NML44116.1 GDSL family lipase [Ramlibacter agri]
MRTTLLPALAASIALLLASCGGGSVDSQLDPTRIIVFGDGFADIGQAGGRYTINDGTVNNWTLTLAGEYGNALATSASGGLSYATGNARVNTLPDAAGSSGHPTVKQQVDTFLASGAPTDTDLVVLAAGTGDVIAEAQAYFSGSETQAQMLANLAQAGVDLGTQVRRLLAAGAEHIVVVGPYDLGKSAWAVQLDQASLLESASTQFNSQFLVSVADLGENVLYVDAAYYFNLVVASPTTYSLDNATGVVCTSVDSGAGIGTGISQVNSSLCTSDTLASGIDPSVYLFADRIYFTPVAQRLFGEYAYGRIRDRW